MSLMAHCETEWNALCELCMRSEHVGSARMVEVGRTRVRSWCHSLTLEPETEPSAVSDLMVVL